jgi:hypothetical protein
VRALADGVAACESALEGLARRGAFDPAAFAAFANAQVLTVWLAPLADSASARALLPGAFVELLEERRRAQPERVARLVAQAAELRDALAAAGVESLVLKGGGLAVRLYPAPERRHQWDVDLLVREGALGEAFQVLGRLGYRVREHPADGAFVRDRIERIESGALHRGKHSLEARREDARVDVHWRIGGRLADRVDHAALWASRATCTLRGERFETLCEEHALCLLLLGIAADLKRGACRGKQLLDLFLALRTWGPGTDWEAFLARRSREGLLRVAVNVLGLMDVTWGGVDAIPALAERLTRFRSRILLPDPADAEALLQNPRGAAENRAWYKRLYPRSRIQHVAWQIADARLRSRTPRGHASASP